MLSFLRRIHFLRLPKNKEQQFPSERKEWIVWFQYLHEFEKKLYDWAGELWEGRRRRRTWRLMSGSLPPPVQPLLSLSGAGDRVAINKQSSNWNIHFLHKLSIFRLDCLWVSILVDTLHQCFAMFHTVFVQHLLEDGIICAKCYGNLSMEPLHQ